MTNRKCPSCGTRIDDGLTCPECGHNLASSVVSTDSVSRDDATGDDTADDSSSPQPGSRVDRRPADDVVADATGNITADQLTKTEGRLRTCLFDQPLIDYLSADEQPEYLLRSIKPGLQRSATDGADDTADRENFEGNHYLLLTDQRILYVAGSEDGDEANEFVYDDIVAVDANRRFGGGWVSFDIADGTTYTFKTSRDAQYVYDAGTYIHTHAGITDAEPPKSTIETLASTFRWWNTNIYKGLTPKILAQTLFIIVAAVGLVVTAQSLYTQFALVGKLAIITVPVLAFVYFGFVIHLYVIGILSMIYGIPLAFGVYGILSSTGLNDALVTLLSVLSYPLIATILMAAIYIFETISLAFVSGAIVTLITQAVFAGALPIPNALRLTLGFIPGLVVGLLLLRYFEYVVITSTATGGGAAAALLFIAVGRGQAKQAATAIRKSTNGVIDIVTLKTTDIGQIIDPLVQLGIDITFQLYVLFVLITVSGIVVQSALVHPNWIGDVARVWHGVLTGQAVPEESMMEE